MTATGPVWEQIRQGRPPSAGRLGEVLSEDAVRLGDEGLAAARAQLAAQVLGAGPLEPLPRRPVRDRRPGQRRHRRLGRPGVGPGAACRARWATTPPCAASRSGWRAAPGAGSTTRAPTSTASCPGVSACTRCCPRWPPTAPTSACGCRVASRRRLDELASWGTFDAPVWRVLRALVHRRVAFVVTGGTGSGKTTLLAALLGRVPTRTSGSWSSRTSASSRSTTRTSCGCRPARPTSRAAGEVSLTALVRQSLRMRPDRLVVGEVRGAEVRELLTALNTGHEGGCGTLHANTSADAVARFEALGALAGLGPAAVHAQLVSAVRVVVHVRRSARGRSSTRSGCSRATERGVAGVVPALRTSAAGGMRRERAGPP